jgi:hypothetical protein
VTKKQERVVFDCTVESSLEIQAPPEVVFDVLTVMRDWPTWSTMLVGQDRGPIERGAKLSLGLRTPQESYDFIGTVTELRRGAAFEWLSRTGIPGIFDGRHRFEITELSSGRSRLRNVEFYSGLLAPLVRRTASMKAAPAGFAKMNQEIAARAERIARSQ